MKFGLDDFQGIHDLPFDRFVRNIELIAYFFVAEVLKAAHFKYDPHLFREQVDAFLDLAPQFFFENIAFCSTMSFIEWERIQIHTTYILLFDEI